MGALSVWVGCTGGIGGVGRGVQPSPTNHQPLSSTTTCRRLTNQPPTYSSPLTFPLPPLTPGDLSSLKGMLALTELRLGGCSLITGTVAVWAHGRVDGGS